MEIHNKVIVITGGAGGIGLAIAKAFLMEDPKKIVLADISFENFDFKNDKVINKQCNVSNQTDLNNLINDVNQEFGLIDIFCSNKGPCILFSLKFRRFLMYIYGLLTQF